MFEKSLLQQVGLHPLIKREGELRASHILPLNRTQSFYSAVIKRMFLSCTVFRHIGFRTSFRDDGPKPLRRLWRFNGGFVYSSLLTINGSTEKSDMQLNQITNI